MPLMSLMAETWNKMAREQELATDWAREVFLLDDQEMADRVDQEWRELMEQGVDSRIASAFVDFKPHLLERKAMLKFRRENPDLMVDGALPEINQPDEAVAYAAVDHFLDEDQQAQLLELFQELVRDQPRT